MAIKQEHTQVVIVGGGVAGLTLATFLVQSGVSCVVLEHHSRSYVETRQRAGVVEASNVGMFETWGLADSLLGGPVAEQIDYRINGQSRIFKTITVDQFESRSCTQQMLVNNLLAKLVDEMGADVRFNITNVALQNDAYGATEVHYQDSEGPCSIICHHIVGCDGSRSISRSSIPDGALTRYEHDFGYAWLAALVEAPGNGAAIMAASDDGFLAQLPRGPERSRYYLQCAKEDSSVDWPDERVWDEIRLRLRDDSRRNATIHQKTFVPLRSVVYAPLQYNNLYLAGDAAHLLPPTGAKGMNLALHDIDVLARGLISAELEGNKLQLARYSESVLPRIWAYQEFSAWMTDTMHDAGTPTLKGLFRQQIARARIDALFESREAAAFHSAMLRGVWPCPTA